VSPGSPASLVHDFPALYRAQFGYVWKTLRRLGAAPREIEDLAHDLFVVVHRHLHRYDPSRPLRPWLFGIAVRVVRDSRRAARNAREVLAPATEMADAALPADEQMAGAEARALLSKLLDGLDLDRRAVFVMHEVDEVPMPEIAAALDAFIRLYVGLRYAGEARGANVARLKKLAREVQP